MSSPPSTPMSQASTRFGVDSSVSLDDPKSLQRRVLERAKQGSIPQDIFLSLVAFRILNALSIKTFFQPDEFFQALEPAWEIAFGAGSGAWITWEWRNHLRSAIHPALLAIVYKFASGCSWMLRLSPNYRADLLLAAPKFAQAVVAALGDYYTWKLGERTYGAGSNEAWAALALTICSPWQWFCSTRTLSNSLETSLTIIALSQWPWQWCMDACDDDSVDQDGLRYSIDQENEDIKSEIPAGQDEDQGMIDQTSKIRCCLLLAALACILRPTNILIWLCVTSFALLKKKLKGKILPLPWEGAQVWVHMTSLSLLPATKKERMTLIREAAFCGSIMLLLSTLVDRLYYQSWTFPPLRFIYFNIAQSLAIFYGRNDWHYYISQGYPLLLTTFLPFGILGIYQSLFPSDTPPPYSNTTPWTMRIKYQLATTSILVPFILSFISHKEVRFIYPLLPLLHILAAAPFTTFFLPAVSPAIPLSTYAQAKRYFLGFLFLSSTAIGVFTTTSHQTAPLTVMTYLRDQHVSHYLSQPPSSFLPPAPSIMTVGFLMPCHSTPWRSHLIYPSIKAWALTCEPPINLNNSARNDYLDEADRFYADPKGFLAETLGTPPKPKRRASSWFGWFGSRQKAKGGFGREDLISAEAWDGLDGLKTWPDYLVFFEQMEPILRDLLKDSAYRDCWKGWNSWAHDDWRRKGDIVVWCLRKQEVERKRRGLPW